MIAKRPLCGDLVGHVVVGFAAVFVICVVAAACCCSSLCDGFNANQKSKAIRSKTIHRVWTAKEETDGHMTYMTRRSMPKPAAI